MPSQSDIVRQMMDEAGILADIRRTQRVPPSVTGWRGSDADARRDFEAFIRAHHDELAKQAKERPNETNAWLRDQVTRLYPPDHPLREMPPRFTPAKPTPTKRCPDCGREHYSTNDYPGGGHFCGGDYCTQAPKRTDKPGFRVTMLEAGERVLSPDEVREQAGLKSLQGDALKHAESMRIEMKPKPSKKPGWFRRLWADAMNAR